MTLQGKYKILQKIGMGGMSFVFKAFSIYHNKECALKEMQDQYLDPESRDKITVQFMNEAVTLSKLSHPGVPYIIETFEDSGKHYIAMEYVSGDSLEDVVVNTEGLLSQSQVLGLVWQILDILEYLHGLPQPVILRDLKPSNVMLSNEGKVKIIDFGIAKIFEQSGAGRTMAKIKGTGSSGFAPPEQYGAAGTDRRSDIYALGATIYYLLTGIVLPDSVDRILSKGKIEPAHDVNETVTEPVQRMIEKMVQLKPGDRFQSVGEIKAYLRDAGLDGTFPAVKPPHRTSGMDEEQAGFGAGEPSRIEPEPAAEEDTRIYLPRQIYKKRQQPVDAAEEPEPPQSGQYTGISGKLQTEQILGSGGMADALKSAWKKEEAFADVSEAASMEPTRRLDRSAIEKYLGKQKAEAEQGRGEAEDSAESSFAPPSKPDGTPLIQTAEEAGKDSGGPAFTLLVVLLVVLFIALVYGAYCTRDFWFRDEKPVKVVDKVPDKKKEEPQAKPKAPVKNYLSKKAQGDIHSIEIAGDVLKLRLRTDNGYLFLRVPRDKFPAKAKAGAEIEVFYKVPKVSPKPPFEISKLTIVEDAPASSTPPPIKKVKRQSDYREPARTQPARQNASPARQYAPPAPPARQAAPARQSAPPPPPPASSGASSGSFTQQRATYY